MPQRIHWDAIPAPDPSWASHGACRHHDPGLWFDEASKARQDNAKAICRACPVAVPCLRYALSVPAIKGIWAATTPNQRTRLRHRTARPVPPGRTRAA